MSELEAALADPEIGSEAAEALSGLIDKIVLTPTAGCPDDLAIDFLDTLDGDSVDGRRRSEYKHKRPSHRRPEGGEG